jgi:hypothetical protein
MARMASASKDRRGPRKIIGIGLSPELASKVKAEAGRRQISLRRLFEELWTLRTMLRNVGSTASKAIDHPRKIIGISLSPELASKVKAEADRRHISLRRLFEELWTCYEKNGEKK